MDFLISAAYAQEGGGGGGAASNLILLVIMIAVFYFLLIRPQQKKTKAHRKMVETLQKGDEIVTNGGLAGYITKLNESGFIFVEISAGVEVWVQRGAVSSLLPKGTIKSNKDLQ